MDTIDDALHNWDTGLPLSPAEHRTIRLHISRLEAECARYRAALEQYADRENWGRLGYEWALEQKDYWNGYDLARAALAPQEEPNG